LKKLVGTVVRTAITAGQPITKGSLVSPGDRGFLAAALGPGMRAVTVPVSSLTGVAGFVFPGDRVDLLLTQSLKQTIDVDGVDQAPRTKVAETIMRNLRVLATDQRARPRKNKKGNVVVKKYKFVTLEATPALAEKISVALSIGTLSLSLRSLAENQAELEQALAKGEVVIPEGATPEEEEEILAKAQAVQTPSANLNGFTSGDQVSRFQPKLLTRRTPKNGVDAVIQQKQWTKKVEDIVKGPKVRVSRGGSVNEVLLDRR